MREAQEIQEIKIAINRLEQNDTHISESLVKISQALDRLVTLQKDHDILRIECFQKITENAAATERAHKRIDRLTEKEEEKEKSRSDFRNGVVKSIALVMFLAFLGVLGVKV